MKPGEISSISFMCHTNLDARENEANFAGVLIALAKIMQLFTIVWRLIQAIKLTSIKRFSSHNSAQEFPFHGKSSCISAIRLNW